MLQTPHQNKYPKVNLLITKNGNSSERMSTLIKGVLNFSKLSSGELIFEKTNLNVILGNIIDDFELLIAEKAAVIHHEILPEIEAIPLQMNQLFTNLLSNSLKFSKKDVSPVISISSVTLTAAEVKKHNTLNPKLSYCRITFKDNGIGFEQKIGGEDLLTFCSGAYKPPGNLQVPA